MIDILLLLFFDKFFISSAENLFHDGKLDQAMEVGDPNSFESFMQSNPLDGEKYLKTVVEVTGIADRTIIYKAFNQSKKSNRDFDVNNAIEWILTMSENSKTGKIIFHYFDWIRMIFFVSFGNIPNKHNLCLL